MAEQCRTFSRDRIVCLQKVRTTRWHSKLVAIEKYIVLVPILKKVLPEDAPKLLSASDEELLAECVLVMREVRCVARMMEFDRQVTILRAPRLLKELFRTLIIFSADQ